MFSRYFPTEEYELRWASVHDEMSRRGFETAVVWGRSAATYDRASDVLYLSNYFSTKVGQAYDIGSYNARAYAAVILRIGQTPELHADEPWPKAGLVSTDRIFWHNDPIRGVADALVDHGITGRVALVGTDFFPVKYWQQFQEMTPKLTWVPCDDLVRKVRLVKTSRELDCYREAGKIASRAIELVMEGLIAGKAESDAAALAASEIIRRGGIPERINCSHGTFVGEACRDPLRGYSGDAPSSGDLVRAFVMGPMFQGYYLDPGRTAVCGGQPNLGQRELIEACARIVEEISSAIRPGMRFSEPAELGDKLVAEVATDKDSYSEKFPFYGHSVGLYFETPYISTVFSDGGQRFEPGMVLGVEAFLSRSGIGSVGFEQNMIVHKDGIELLTTPPMLWH